MTALDRLVETEPPATPVPARTPTDAPPLVRLRTGKQDTRRSRRFSGLERFLGVVLFFAVWELAVRVGWISAKDLAAPSKVVDLGWDMLRDGTLGPAIWASLRRVLWGLAIGIPVATLLALAAGLTRIGDDLIDRNIQMLRFVPVIGLLPLFILWLGIGETVKVTLIVIGVAFPVYVNTYSAIKQLDPGYLELSHVVGLGRFGRIRKVVLPGAMPGFLVGVRLATAVAWLVLVFAEQVNAEQGLGALIIKAQTFFQSDVILVCLLVYAVLGLLTDTVVRLLEKGVLRWQPGR